jgi:hypothetical protein
MSATHSSGVVRIFRLTNEPGGLGLSCTSAGVSLAGVPLLHSTRARFVPRPAAEIATLLKAAYGADGDQAGCTRASAQSLRRSIAAISLWPRSLRFTRGRRS